jgi:hypothetical protein
MAVADDSLPVELLIIVLTVPSLDLVPRVSRLDETGRRDDDVLSCLSCRP